MLVIENLNINIIISSELYSRNPDSSELGKKIVSSGIDLIHKIGFESFTFKKLGAILKSPESSIYRYFKNKHIFLTYLTSWYWAWTDYRLAFATANIKNTKERLIAAIDILTMPIAIDDYISHINEVKLSNIIVSESMKAYHTKDVDSENKRGFFKTYKQVVKRVGNLVLSVNSTFEYPHMLISTVIEGVHQQKYFAAHLPELTDVKENKNAISDFYRKMVLEFVK